MYKHKYRRFVLRMKALVEKWLANNHITKARGSWLHYVGKIIHKLARLTSIFSIPGPGKKYYKKTAFMNHRLRARLKLKYNSYLKMIESHQDSQGFVLTDHCDATLFSGLLASLPLPKDVIMSSAKNKGGYWLRRPANHPQCYPKHSKSSISRDMILGVMWYCWFSGKKQLMKTTYNHIKDHDYVMGFGIPSRLLLMPGLEATMAEIAGEGSWWTRNMLQTWPQNLTDYQIHLAFLHALLRGDMKGYITKSMFEMFDTYSIDNYNNPLYQFAYELYSIGCMDRVAELLLDERIWPSDRLPRRKDRKSAWVTQRDYGPDWKPSDENPDKEHSGGDFLMVAWLVLRELEK